MRTHEKMKGKTKFLRMYWKLPEKAKRELVYDFTATCFTLSVCMIEITNDTKLGKEILKKLGYDDT